MTEAESDAPEVERDYDLSLPEFEADPDQLTQVILNITRNAGQAMSGQGTITLRSRARRQYTLVMRHKLVCSVDIIDTDQECPALLDQFSCPWSPRAPRVTAWVCPSPR